MVLQPQIQPARNYGTIPMETRLWDKSYKPDKEGFYFDSRFLTFLSENTKKN
jgi:hypothetical protein